MRASSTSVRENFAFHDSARRLGWAFSWRLDMPRSASSTGLIAARVKPVRRPKPKKLELMGPVVPAPFTLRPFAGLFNPYHTGCSVLCNHPADGEAKQIVRRAKETWISEGKALQLSAEMELLRASLLAQRAAEPEGPELVPEELFRRYTETDSRPVSRPSSTEPPDDEIKLHSAREAREKTQLVLDLRASSHEIHDNIFRENETLSWRALTLEPIPSSRRSETTMSIRRKSPLSSRQRAATAVSASSARSIPALEVSDAASTRSAPARGPDLPLEDEDEDEDDSSPEASQPMRRRGKLRRKKRKCRRASIYGQPTEVRDPPEPFETQVSQIDEGSRRGSVCPRLEETKQASLDKMTLPVIKHDMPPSFLPPDVIKELSRELDQEVVECEFNAKRRFALEEALRITTELHPPVTRGPRVAALPITHEVPRLFYRQSARFELLDSQSLVGLKPLDYLARYVHISETRKTMFSRAFNKFREDTAEGPRYILTTGLHESLREVMGRPLTDDEIARLERSLAITREKLDFRTWCGICAFTERVIPELPPRDRDPASWLEKADFEMLEKRLRNVKVDEKLVEMLRLIRDR